MHGRLGQEVTHFCRTLLTAAINAAGRVTLGGLASQGLGRPPAAQPPWALGQLGPHLGEPGGSQRVPSQAEGHSLGHVA